MSADSVISKEALASYRDKTYRYAPNLRIASAKQAVRFVDERGFVFFWPNKGIELPSLWGTVAGDRPVPNNHDDPAHVTWNWKDEMLAKKRWFYARVLCKRSTIISLKLLPCFYALSPNYGTPEEDYLLEYEQGKLSQEEKAVYEALLDNGALNTFILRKEARLSSSANNSRFSRALDNLQRDFRILPVGIADAGAWHYSFIYDAVHRAYPDLIERSHGIRKYDAMRQILDAYFLSVGAAQFRHIQKIFRWSKQDIQNNLENLIQQERILANGSLEGSLEKWFALPQLLA